MRKFITYVALTAVLFMYGIGQVFAALPVLEPILVPFDCDVFGTCAVYVDDEPNPNLLPAGTKDDWFESITDAVHKVKSDSDYNTIIIAEGNYSLNGTPESMPFEFDSTNSWGTAKAINIMGGYAEGFDDRDPEMYRTIIDGNDAVENVFKVEDLGGKISGIEFTNFMGSGSAPIDVDNQGATSYNFTVEYNKFYGNTSVGSYSSMIIDLDNSNKASVYDNEITDNTGSGLNSYASFIGDIEAYNNVFTGNDTWTGIGCTDGATLYNNYLLNNEFNQAINAYGDCMVYNNTIVGNTVASVSDSAVILMSYDTNKIANNLIAYNTGNQPFYHLGEDTSTFEYNAMFDNGSDPSGASLTDGNLLCDPLFAGTSYNGPDDVKLGEGSECIDAGKVVSAVTEDYYGELRPLDGDGEGGEQYDPGAYEAPEYSEPPSTTAPSISGLGVSPATFSPDGDGTGDTTTISFNISDNADVSVTVLNMSDVELNKLKDNEAESAGSILLTWNGENELGDVVEDGSYKVLVEISNTNGDDSDEVTVDVDTSGYIGCAGYSDVPASHSSCEAIEYMQSLGAMTGNPDGTFAPDDYLQRDQVAKIVLETFGLFDGAEDYCGGEEPFPDVTSSDWAYQYICRGVELGMITGYEGGDDAGYYRPARSVNRVEFLALTLRNLTDDMPDLSSTSYDDVEADQWYSGYAKYSYDNSLFTGANLYFSQFTKRAEVADVIYALHNLGKI